MFSRKTFVAVVLGAVVLVGSPAYAQTQAAKEPNWEAMPIEMLDQYAALYRINLGAAKSKEAKIAVLRDAWQDVAHYDFATMLSMATEPQTPAKPPATASRPVAVPSSSSINLPPAEILRPRLPDLSQATVPGRALNVVLLILGAFGVGVIVFGTGHFLYLAGQAFAGKLAKAVLIEKFLTYVAAFAVTFFVLGGSMYAFLRAVIDFFVTSA